VARADHEIEPIEIELLDECREKRQALAVVVPDTRQQLEERSVHPTVLDGRGYRPTHVEQREQLGIRKPLAQDVEHFFAAAHPGEPVVDECDPHIVFAALRR
jgi:hypothetical protein